MLVFYGGGKGTGCPQKTIDDAESEDPLQKPHEKYIIPPDPAVVRGQRQPGEHVVVEHKHPKNMKRAKTLPESQELDEFHGEGLASGGHFMGGLIHHNTEPNIHSADGTRPTNGKAS